MNKTYSLDIVWDFLGFKDLNQALVSTPIQSRGIYMFKLNIKFAQKNMNSVQQQCELHH